MGKVRDGDGRAADNTAEKLPAHLRDDLKFQPGQSGNPQGRPKGSRNKLGEAFLSAMHDDFEAHGVSAIVEVRETKPDAYLKVIASILPRDLNVNVNHMDDMTDDELIERIRALDATIRPFLHGEDGRLH
ncbi:DUF5681 domain-containing protein [Aurantimonas sp. E1-2-R+4]|uniref:DUF5681 domain-containing protein n=1 Tax=Aurantimonas sp. E1-2-R+4 TaxID=3113714 RepID=UPI002F94181F